MTGHVHYFRRINGRWRCADEGCQMAVDVIAAENHAATCTWDNPCPECAADLELLKRYPDPFATIGGH